MILIFKKLKKFTYFKNALSPVVNPCLPARGEFA